MPRLIYYSRDILLVFGVSEDKAVIRSIFLEPLIRLCVLEAVVLHTCFLVGHNIRRNACVMLAVAGELDFLKGIRICLFIGHSTVVYPVLNALVEVVLLILNTAVCGHYHKLNAVLLRSLYHLLHILSRTGIEIILPPTLIYKVGIYPVAVFLGDLIF